MFWFMSPWEAARRSLEAQRQLMAWPWIFMAAARRYQGFADGEQATYEVPPSPSAPAAVPARRATDTIKGAVGARRKKRKSSRKKDRVDRKK
jgi:hypothetical protein